MTFDTVLGQQPCQSLRLVKDIIKTMRDLNEGGHNSQAFVFGKKFGIFIFLTNHVRANVYVIISIDLKCQVNSQGSILGMEGYGNCHSYRSLSIVHECGAMCVLRQVICKLHSIVHISKVQVSRPFALPSGLQSDLCCKLFHWYEKVTSVLAFATHRLRGKEDPPHEKRN